MKLSSFKPKPDKVRFNWTLLALSWVAKGSMSSVESLLLKETEADK